MICERGASGSGHGLIADYLSSAARRSDLISRALLLNRRDVVDVAVAASPVSATYPDDFHFRRPPQPPATLARIRPRKRRRLGNLVASRSLARSSRSILEKKTVPRERDAAMTPGHSPISRAKTAGVLGSREFLFAPHHDTLHLPARQPHAYRAKGWLFSASRERERERAIAAEEAGRLRMAGKKRENRESRGQSQIERNPLGNV